MDNGPSMQQVAPNKRHLAHNYAEQMGPDWKWVPEGKSGGHWEKDGQWRYPVIYAESEG